MAFTPTKLVGVGKPGIPSSTPAAAVPAAQESTAQVKASPAEGYNVHVLAPHLVDAEQMGPYYHYCKVIAPDPQMQCIVYDSTEPTAILVQVEWIYAKKITRTQVTLQES